MRTCIELRASKESSEKLPALVKDVNELQEQVAELQKIVGADVRKMDVQTEDLVFKYVKTKKDIDDEKLRKPYKDKNIPVRLWPLEIKRAKNRIDKRKADAKKAAKKAKVEVLGALKAELKAEVQKLSARVATLPGSAVWHL